MVESWGFAIDEQQVIIMKIYTISGCFNVEVVKSLIYSTSSHAMPEVFSMGAVAVVDFSFILRSNLCRVYQLIQPSLSSPSFLTQYPILFCIIDMYYIHS